MNSTKRFILLFLFYVLTHHNVDLSSGKDISFETADLAVDDMTENGMVHLEAFLSTGSKLILDNENTKKYKQLKWLSLGVPQLVVADNVTNFLKFHQQGFYFRVNMLTNSHKNKFVQLVKQKHEIDVLPTQIISLVPSKFDCVIQFFDDEGKEISLSGSAMMLEEFPIRVDFKEATGSVNRLKVEKNLKDLGRAWEPIIECDFIVNGKDTKINKLQIKAQQLQNLGLEDEVFGPASSVYVSRDQMSLLASEIYSNLDINEEYQMSESQFSQNFIDDFIKQTSDVVFKHVNIDDALKSLSGYNFNNDLQPDIIKRELSNIFKVKSEGPKKQIVLSDDNYSDIESSNSKSFEVGMGFGPFGANYSQSRSEFNKKSAGWSQQNKPINDQLKELNILTDDKVSWDFQGEKIVPKTIRVSRLIKSKFSKDITLNRVKSVQYDVLFKKKFKLYTSKLSNFKQDCSCLSTETASTSTRPLTKTHTSTIRTADQTRIQTTTTSTSTQVHNFNGTLKLNISVTGGYQRMLPLSNGDLVRGSSGSTIQIWDIQNSRVKRYLTSVHFRPYVFGVLSNGDLVAGYLDNKTILIWDLKVTQGESLKRIIQTNESFLCLTVLKNDDLAIGQGGSTNYDIVIRDSQNGQVKRRLVGHISYMYQIIILPNDNLVSCSWDKTVKIWNTSNTTPLKSIAHSSPVVSIAILKNGYLASGFWDGKIEIRNLETGDLIRVLNGQSGAICENSCLHVLDNGNLLSGSYDRTLKVWNPNDGSLLTTSKSHRDSVIQTSFLPNGDLVTTSRDEICIWK